MIRLEQQTGEIDFVEWNIHVIQLFTTMQLDHIKPALSFKILTVAG